MHLFFFFLICPSNTFWRNNFNSTCVLIYFSITAKYFLPLPLPLPLIFNLLLIESIIPSSKLNIPLPDCFLQLKFTFLKTLFKFLLLHKLVNLFTLLLFEFLRISLNWFSLIFKCKKEEHQKLGDVYLWNQIQQSKLFFLSHLFLEV